MKRIQASDFKVHCLSIIETISRNHEPVIVTRYGKPIVKIEPVNSEKDTSDKPLKGKAIFIGDIISPVDEEWEASL